MQLRNVSGTVRIFKSVIDGSSQPNNVGVGCHLSLIDGCEIIMNGETAQFGDFLSIPASSFTPKPYSGSGFGL